MVLIDPQIKAQLRQTIHISKKGDYDYNTGEYSYSEPVVTPARITGKLQKVINVKGIEVVSNVQIILEGPVSMDCSDRIWLSWDKDFRNPQAASNFVDEIGNHDFSKLYM